MFFKQNKLIAMILLIIIVLFSFYSEYYAQKFRVENFDDVPSCNSGDVPTCSAVVLDHDPYEYTANAMNGEDYILKTHEYMQVIGKELGYDYVLSFRIGGPMLYADPAHDITQDVIKLLNERYNSITIE